MNVSVGPLTSPADAYEIYRVCEEYDQPDVPVLSPDGFVARLSNPWPGRAQEHYLGFLDERPVGYLEISLPMADNLHNMDIELSVRPEYRRRGVGRALFDLMIERARAAGRKNVIGPTTARHPDGSRFAAAMGARPGLEEVRSRLEIRALDQDRLDALLDDAWRHAGGYRLMLWTGEPPEDIIDDVAYLDSRFNADAPIGDLSWEPEKVDAGTVRESERQRVLRGRVSYHAGALHAERLVAWTMIAGSAEEPAHAWQNITLVDPGHRGHRLGMLIKLANLGQVRRLRPGLEVIDTFNAGSNEQMLRINRAIGFRAADSATHWQLTV